jgi:hypothetical protein
MGLGQRGSRERTTVKSALDRMPIVIENPYSSPLSTSCTEKVSPSTCPVSRLAAFGAGAWKGAKRGFVIVAILAAMFGAVAWAIIILFFHPNSSPEDRMTALMLFPVGVCAYGLCGAVLGAAVMGTVATLRFKTLSTSASKQQTNVEPRTELISDSGNKLNDDK